MSGAAAATVVVLDVDGAISPGTADYVIRGLETATDRQAHLVVLRMDTPGGLNTAMRQVIKHILASPAPVAVFVALESARTASAGTYIPYASHIAVMAPATNLGAATPVMIGIRGITGKPEPGDLAQKDGRENREKKAGAAKSNGAEMTAPGTAIGHKQINDASALTSAVNQRVQRVKQRVMLHCIAV